MSTHNIPFSIYKRKSANINSNLQLLDFFQGTRRRVRNSRGKGAVSVRATEVRLYYDSQVMLITCENLITLPLAESYICA